MKFIVNADDFGLNSNVNNAIIEAYRSGLVSSTTIMANGDGFDEALVEYKKGNIDNIGIHLNLTEGRPLTDAIAQEKYFCDANGYFHKEWSRYKPLNSTHRKLVRDELQAQIDKCRDSGIELTHADSHHHIHTAPAIRWIVERILINNGINKVRIQRNLDIRNSLKRLAVYNLNLLFKLHGFSTTKSFGSAKDFMHQKNVDDVCEIMVHPAYKEGIIIDTLNGHNLHGDPLRSALKFISSNDKLISYREIK